MPPHLVGTHMSNNQQQLSTQEFSTSRYLIVMFLLPIYIITFYKPYQTQWYVYLIGGGPYTKLTVSHQI